MNSLWPTPWLSKKQISMYLIFNLLILAFFRHSELLVCHSKLCPLVSGSYLKINDSSPVMTCLKKIFGTFDAFKKVQAHIPSLVRVFRTSFAQIFYMPSSLVKMSWTVDWFKFSSLPIILTVKRRSDLTRVLTLVTFSSVFDVQGLPERNSSSTLSRPSKIALRHLKIYALYTACSP